MNNKVIFDEKDTAKLNKLSDFTKDLKITNLQEVYNIILPEKNAEDKKKIFITLLAHYLSNDFIKWSPMKDKIETINQKCSPEKKVKSTFSFFGLLKSKNQKKDSGKKADEKKFIELYINIGKDKRIFPKDLIHFICSSMKIDANDINNIRIYEKYSFFQVPFDYAEKAIVLLSVKSLRGKNIKVNYSKNDSSAS